MSPMINRSAPAAISTSAIASPARSASRQSSAVRASAWSIGRETDVVRRNLRRDVIKIIIDAQFEDPQRDAVLPSKDVCAGDARDEGPHHHGRDLPRIGGDAIGGDAMITSQDHRPHLVQGTWRAGRLAGRHPGGQVLKSAERTQRLGQCVQTAAGLGVRRATVG